MVMASIQELGNERLTEIAREMLDVRFGSVCAWSDKMSENEYRFALRTIAQGRYLEDALAHIPDKMWGPLQASSSWATIPQAFGPTIALEVRISPLAGSYAWRTSLPSGHLPPRQEISLELGQFILLRWIEDCLGVDDEPRVCEPIGEAAMRAARPCRAAR